MLGVAANILYDFPYVYHNERSTYNLDQRIIGHMLADLILARFIKIKSINNKVEGIMTTIKNTTTKKIGKINYIVTSTSSENAKETLEKKIERWVKKEVEKMCI